MKNNKNLYKSSQVFTDSMDERIKTLEHVIASKIKSINGLIFWKGGRGLIKILLKMVRTVRPKASKSVVKQVAGFAFLLHHLVKTQGVKGTVLYLKACQVLLQQSVGGYKVVDLSDLKMRPRRNRAGLPLVIPAGVRTRITRDRSIPDIRLWMTLFGFFRIMQFKGDLKLSTITNPGTLNEDKFIPGWELWLSVSFRRNLIKHSKLPRFPEMSMFPILKGGPTTVAGTINSSGFSLVWASRLWIRYNELYQSFITLTEQLKAKSILARLELIASAKHSTLDNWDIWGPYQVPPHKPLHTPWYNFIQLMDWSAKGILVESKHDDGTITRIWKGEIPRPVTMGLGFLGKLGFKIEPAGKVRVFAMVDAWTQWLLSPLHKWVFSILRTIAYVDGTFDQLAPVERLQKVLDVRKRTISSIDLSAATDRLPIILQKSVIKVLLRGIVPDSAAFADAWKSILVDRPYALSISSELRKQCEVPKDLPRSVKYATGQPMGALSSWAMLALTHHALVQYAYFNATHKTDWFSDYAILGDDIVIANGKVATAYRLLLKEIGVEAGLAKSIISRSRFVVEFAKKFFVDKTQANMVPFKEAAATWVSTSLVLEFTRKYELSLNAILAFLGFGYKARIQAVNAELFSLGTRLRVLMVWLTHPLSPFGVPSYSEWILLKSNKNILDLNWDVIKELHFNVRELVLKKMDKLDKVYKSYYDSIPKVTEKLDTYMPVTVDFLPDGRVRGPGVIPWRALLNPDLSNPPALNLSANSIERGNALPDFIGLNVDGQQDLIPWPENHEFLGASKSRGSFRFTRLETGDLGVNPDELYISCHSKFGQMMSEFERLGDNGQWLDGVDVALSWYFGEDGITERIPEEFWKEIREEARPYRDFLSVYKLWQDLSKSAWKAHYKKQGFKIPPALGEQEGFLNSRKVKRTKPLDDINSLSDYKVTGGTSWLNSWIKPPTRKGGRMINWIDTEWFSGRFIWTLISLWIEKIVRVAIATALRWLVYCLLLIGLLLLGLPGSEDPFSGEILNEYVEVGWTWVGLAILWLLIFIFFPVSVGSRGSISIDTNTLDPITRFNLGIPGPYSPVEIERLQDYLEVRAWMENLAISPIGELWPSDV